MSAVKPRSGSEWIIDFLASKGADCVFGYPGGPIIALFEVIYRKKFPIIMPRHEQGAAHAAEGYAKVSGKPGVIIATSGPGATNLVTGLADAYLDSVPLLAITGAVARRATGTDAFQEADITGIAQPVTKYSYLVMKPEELPGILEEAWDMTTSGRPGPVLINIPKDILAGPIPETAIRNGAYVRHRPEPSRTVTATEQVIRMLRQSQRPLLLAGGGCIISEGCAELLRQFAERYRVPIANTLMGKGLMPDDHPMSLGQAGMHGTPQSNVAVGRCDLLIAVGARFSDRIIGDPDAWNASPVKRNVIHVDIDPAEIGKNIHVDLEIEDDAATFFRAMLDMPATEMPERGDWHGTLDDLRQRYHRLVDGMYSDGSPLRPQRLIRDVAARFAAHQPIVVTDVGQHQMFVAQHYPLDRPRSFITSGGLGTMGFGLPAAIGAALAAPGKRVVLFVGDGGFQMTLQELGLLSQLGLPVTVIVVDNKCLGMVRQWQELFFDKHYSSTLLDDNPDFLKIAEAYRVSAGFACDAETLDAQMDGALATSGPYLIHAAVAVEENVYPMIPAGKMPQDLMMPGLTWDNHD